MSLKSKEPVESGRVPAAQRGAVAEQVADCSGGESFALMVLGESMAPEFNDGEIIIIEPDGAVHDGSFVLVWHKGEWTFRQLKAHEGAWMLHALNPAFGDQPLDDLSSIRGVVIQKAIPGRRRATRHYI